MVSEGEQTSKIPQEESGSEERNKKGRRKNWEQRDQGERSRRSPRRGSEKPSGGNRKQSAHVKQEQKNKRKRE